MFSFPNEVLEEEVYIKQPPSFESMDKTIVCKLCKTIYGLKQAPRAWLKRLNYVL